jgi:prevent-host-death family protein
VTAPDELPISDARDHFADVLGRATYAGQITYITKRGQRVGAVVPVDVAEAAEAAEDEYLSRLARDADEELGTGAPTRPLADLVEELDLGLPQQKTGPGDTDRRPRPAASGTRSQHAGNIGKTSVHRTLPVRGRYQGKDTPSGQYRPAEDSSAAAGDGKPRRRS